VGAYNKLNDLISTMKTGDKLPTEDNLAKELNISRNTVRQALQILHEDRLIYKKRGSGTYISGAPYLGKGNMNLYCTNEESLRQQGLEACATDLKITFEDADDITKKALRLEKDTSIYVITRAYRNVNDSKIVYLYSMDFIPVSCFKGESANLGREELIQYYENKGKTAICGVGAVLAGSIYSEPLNVSRDTPLLLLNQVIMDWQGNRLYLNKTYINTFTTDYSLNLQRIAAMSGGNRSL
jgi:GntR family transcriptional regulator